MATDSNVDDESWFTGHHIFKNVWTTMIGEILTCMRERNNPHDHFSVAVYKDTRIVGHIARKLAERFSGYLIDGKLEYQSKNIWNTRK